MLLCANWIRLMVQESLGRPERVRDFSRVGRILGRSWIVNPSATDARAARRTRTRFTDLEGHAPSLWSIACLPNSVWTKWRSRNKLLMPEPAPWLVHDAISLLKKLVTPGCRVLEVGAGNSTIWFLRRGARVTSIEGDAAWADAIRSRVRSDPKIGSTAEHTLMQCTGDDALRFIRSLPDHKFDIVLIDSVPEHTRRGPALKAARSKVKNGGYMILDNSDDPAHLDGREAMSDRQLQRYSGFGPMRLCVSQTTFWQVRT